MHKEKQLKNEETHVSVSDGASCGLSGEIIADEGNSSIDLYAELPESGSVNAVINVAAFVDTVIEGATGGLYNPELVLRKEQNKSITQADEIEPKTPFWQKLKNFFRKKESWMAIAGLLLSVVFIVFLLFDPSFIEKVRGWGYIGLFIISLLGSSAVVVPVPGMAVQFALGAKFPPPFGWPLWLGPLFVGLVAAVAETIGAITVYMTGYGGGVSIAQATKKSPAGRFAKMYNWVIRLMKSHSFIALFLVSAIPNPFFYPVSLVAGAARVGVVKFTFFVFLGKLVKCSAIAYLGYLSLGGFFS